MHPLRQPAVRFGSAVLLALAVLFGGGGCALTSKADPVSPRYLSPVLAPAARVSGSPARKPLRLYRVRAGSHLKEKIVSRLSPYEVTFYEERRWVEQPDQVLERALSRALFEERGLRRVVSGPAPSLEVELVSFDEIQGSQRGVRIELVVLLYDEGVALLEETMSVEKPVPESDELDEWQEFAKVAGEALREIVDRVADRVVARLVG
jgi:uncharacterized lipoprotein YmbA